MSQTKSRRLPSLNLLRAFEAAARHKSLTLAAAELYVTPSAIGHQIKALENWLGFPLVKREGRHLGLTALGLDYFPSLCKALDMMDRATGRIKPKGFQHVLSVSVMPTFSAQWLIPRLSQFIKNVPWIDVQITTAQAAVFEPEIFDVTIHCMTEDQSSLLRERPIYNGAVIKEFLPDGLTPVCRPNLISLDSELDASELIKHSLLHSRSTPMAWADWFEAAGLPLERPSKSLTFDHGHLAIQAAMQQLGIAMGSPSLCSNFVLPGYLHIPFPRMVIYPKMFYWMCSRERSETPQVAEFCRWLESEARSDAINI